MVSLLKFTVLLVLKFCIFGIVECANNTDAISHCTNKVSKNRREKVIEDVIAEVSVNLLV